jgi:hypothetical protein
MPAARTAFPAGHRKSRPPPALLTIGRIVGEDGRLPTYRLTTRNSAMMAAWFVVIE